MRTFDLLRHRDVSGVSGVGTVAHGVELPSGRCVIEWAVPGKPRTVGIYDSIDAVFEIHGHNGSTDLVWTTP